jgi:hypothetical protein
VHAPNNNNHDRFQHQIPRLVGRDTRPRERDLDDRGRLAGCGHGAVS